MVERTRTLGFWIAFSMGLGTMIAAGIFSLSGQAVADIGSSAVIAFVIAALVAGVTAASYSEFASIYSQNGGGYLFSSRTFDNNLLIYAVGVSLFLGYTGTTAFYLATMDEWFHKFIIPSGVPVPHGLVGIGAAVLLGTLNARGTEESGSFQLIVTGAKVAVLLAFIGGALSFAGPSQAITDFSTSFQFGGAENVNILSTAGTAFITFFGFSAIAASAGEIIEPRKTVPKAIGASMVTVTVLYTFVIVALVNTPETVGGTPRAEVLQAGETAMGQIAQVFLGGIGQAVIVAGAIFSMVSASNASILAGSGIGYLMGRQGQAPRRFSRIHPEYETPFWSVATVTGTIVAMIAVFIFVLGEGSPVPLGLSGLTNFATLNLLAPLAVVNVALIYSRRRYPDIDRPFSVPLGSVLPVVGILANVALIFFLAAKGLSFGVDPASPPEHTIVVLSNGAVAVQSAVGGLLVGVLLEVVLVAAYLGWGGKPDVEELIAEASPTKAVASGTSSTTVSAGGATTSTEEAEVPEDEDAAEAEEEDDHFRILVPIARVHRAPEYAKYAATIGKLHDEEPIVQFLTVTQVPEQTPTEAVDDVAAERTDRLTETLEDIELPDGVALTVEGHICQDLAFDILQTAREDGADRIVMGYPEKHPAVAESIEYQSPCDVMFISGLGDDIDTSVVNIGTGGGPHHEALLGEVARFVGTDSEIHVIDVTPETGGTREALEQTLEAFPAGEVDVEVHEVDSTDVAHGLVTTAADNGGVLMIGASRTRFIGRRVFGSTPDRVIEEADEYGVPVVVYASHRRLVQRLEDVTFPAYRYLRKRTS